MKRADSALGALIAGSPRYRGLWHGRLAAAAIRLFARSAIVNWGLSHWTQAADWKEGDVMPTADIINHPCLFETQTCIGPWTLFAPTLYVVP